MYSPKIPIYPLFPYISQLTACRIFANFLIILLKKIRSLQDDIVVEGSMLPDFFPFNCQSSVGCRISLATQAVGQVFTAGSDKFESLQIVEDYL